MKTILAIILLGLNVSFQLDRLQQNTQQIKDIPPDSTINGLWRSTEPIYGDLYIWIQKDRPLIIMNFVWGGMQYQAIEYKWTDYIGDCLFYYETFTQKLIYVATYTDHQLFRNFSFKQISYEKINLSDLDTYQKSSIAFPQPDTLIMWQLRKPPIYGYYNCNDTTIQLTPEDDIYYSPFTKDSNIIFFPIR